MLNTKAKSGLLFVLLGFFLVVGIHALVVNDNPRCFTVSSINHCSASDCVVNFSDGSMGVQRSPAVGKVACAPNSKWRWED